MKILFLLSQYAQMDKTRTINSLSKLTLINLISLIFFIATGFISLPIFAKTPTSSSANILVLGDSISAGFGFELEQGWVNLLEQQLKNKYNLNVINASISGELSGGGERRIAPLIKKYQPAIIILELGGNDGLRGLSLKTTRQNLQSIITQAKNADANILLLGMQIPPNYGARYTREFSQIYPELAKSNQLDLVPLFLNSIAQHTGLMQSDGIHPNAQAQPQILTNLLPHIVPMLDSLLINHN